MASEIVITLVGLFCTTVSSVVTFVLTRRKYNTEVDSQQIENMEKSFDAYKKMMEETLDALLLWERQTPTSISAEKI